MNIDVFISYKSEEKALALQLKELITTNGFTCWMAPESIPAASDYASEIGSAIDNCQVMLLLLSERAQKSQWVPKEISYGLSQNKPVIPFHIDESALVKPFDFTLTNVQRIEAYERLEAAYQELLERINTLIAVPKLSTDIRTIELRSTPFVKNHDLVGREQELSKLHQFLRDDHIVFIFGIGGTGKTELVNQYVSQYHQEYKTIIVTKYESSLTDIIISAKYFSIEGIERNQMESDHDFALRKLAKIKELSNDNTLIVIDNFDTSEDVLLDELLHGPYQILFTTRMNFDYLGVPVMTLGELEHDKQIELFQKNYKRPLIAQQMPLLEELLYLIQGHTLTIELIARLMAIKHMKIEVMLEQLKQAGISPSMTGLVHHKATKAQTVYSHIEALFDLESLSEDEFLVMQNLSLMPLAGVSFGDFMEWCQYDDGEIINNLIERSWIKYNVEQDRISLHPIIADIVTSKTKNIAQTCSVMLDALAMIFKDSWDMKLERRIELGEIAKAIYYKLPPSENSDFNLQRFIYSIFLNLEYMEHAINSLKDLNCVYRSQRCIEFAWVCYYTYELCRRYHYFEKAAEYIECAVEITRDILPQSLDLSFFLAHLARTYGQMADETLLDHSYLEKAFELLQEAENIHIFCVNEDRILCSAIYSFGFSLERIQTDQAAARLCLFAQNCYFRKEYADAMKYGILSCRKYYKLYDGLSAAIVSPLSILSRSYSKLGKYEIAIQMRKIVINIQTKYWEPDYYMVVESIEALADIYFEYGKIEEGLAQLYYILECLANKQDYYTNYIQKINEKIRQYERM